MENDEITIDLTLKTKEGIQVDEETKELLSDLLSYLTLFLNQILGFRERTEAFYRYTKELTEAQETLELETE